MTKKILNLPLRLGAKPDPIDRRDLRYEDFIAGKARPAGMPTFEKGYDVEEAIGQLRDDHQDDSYRCVAQGGTNDVEMSILATTRKHISLSIRDAYSQIYLPGGGAYPRDVYKLANKKGICEEKYCPSYPEDGSKVSEAFSRKRGVITPEREQNALEWRIGAYRSISTLDLEVMAQAIYENHGCGGGYRFLKSNMGHFIFFNGYGMHKGYHGLKYRDSYSPYQKWMVKHNGQFYYSSTNQPLAVPVQLYSIWTAEAGDNWTNNMDKKKVDLAQLNIISNELLFRDADDGLKKAYLGQNNQALYDEDFVRKELGKSKERWQIINGVNWLKKWKVINLFSGKIGD
jgi:hypothetical protein